MLSSLKGLKAPALVAAGIALVLSASVRVPLTAQEIDPLSRLDPNSRYAIELVLDSAHTLGIPNHPLMSKTLEGIAKHQDGRRIIAAVRSLFTSLKEARVVLGPTLNEAEWTAAASVLQAGVPAGVLAKFRPTRQSKQQLSMPFVVLADLITRGVPIDTASSAIVQLWQRGAADGDFIGLWKAVDQDILSGENPGAALQQRIRESIGRIPPGGSRVPSSTAREPDNPSS